MRPLIGVTPLLDTKLDSYWMLPDYMQGIQRAGGMPVMLPFQHDPESIDQMVALCDGFVFTGGEDIDPAYYHTEREPVCGVSLPERDELETRLLRAALAADKPVLAICRGMQLLNVVLGGTLWQDLPSQRPGEVSHSQASPTARPPIRWIWYRIPRCGSCSVSTASASTPGTTRASGTWPRRWR